MGILQSRRSKKQAGFFQMEKVILSQLWPLDWIFVNNDGKYAKN